MSEIHRSRGKRPKRQTPIRLFDSQQKESAMYELIRTGDDFDLVPVPRRASTKSVLAFVNRLVKRRRKKGYKVGRQGGLL
jgi:hypothetical protein